MTRRRVRTLVVWSVLFLTGLAFWGCVIAAVCS